jgi:hypothetical protein
MNVLDHFHNGLINNYDMCCILWFVGAWSRDDNPLWKWADGEQYFTRMFSEGFVLCPDCIVEKTKDMIK